MTNFIKSESVKPTGLSITLRFFLVTLLSFALLMGIIVAYISYTARTQADISVKRALYNSAKVLDTRLQSRFSSIERLADTFSIDPVLRPFVYVKNSTQLQARLTDYQQAYRFDVLIFCDDSGTILARSDRPDVIGRSVKASSLFAKALSGESAFGFMKRQNHVLLIVAVPVFDNVAKDIVRGAVGLGFLITPSLAEEIKDLTNSEIALFSYKQSSDEVSVVHSTESRLEQELVNHLNKTGVVRSAFVEQAKTRTSTEITIGEEEFLMSLLPLKAHDGRLAGLVLALGSKSAVMRPYMRILKGAVVVGAACLGLSVLLMFFISRSMTRPIISLVNVANSIRDGILPEKVEITRTDELGILEQAVADMGQAIKKKAELEEYLAGFSEELSVDNELTPEDESIIEQEDLSNENQIDGLLAVGELLDSRYEILRALGRGGMGMVYLARDKELNEKVAIKLLNSENATKEDLDLFKEEIRLARRITHNNIVRTYDLGVVSGLHYVSMEYVPGFSLKRFIETHQQVSLSIGIIMARQILTAMAAAHAQGIVHRDLKADNIVISNRGVLKIMDFGIATFFGSRKLEDEAERGIEATSQSREIVGTPRYMAPEQLRGDEQDARVDIYAMGVLLFLLFTKEYPFNGSTFAFLGHQHLSEAPPKIRQINPSLPESLESIIDRALAKMPDERFASMSDMRNALDAVASLS